MPSHLRFEKHDTVGWTLAQGPCLVGTVVPGHITLLGYADTSRAATAAEVAARVLQHWTAGRTDRPFAPSPSVTLTPDGLGFTCDVPENLWDALLLELAQRLHAATASFRPSTMELV